MAKATLNNITPSRRAILAGAAALPVLAVSAVAGTDDDARILELERLINVQFEKGDALAAQIDEDHDERLAQHVLSKKHASSDEVHRTWMADPHNAAQDALCEAHWKALAEAEPYTKEMFETPAKTLAGRRAKLRVLKSWLWHDDFTTPLDDADWEIEMTRRLLAELCEMAA